ncbi:MAG: hypothetical protein Q9208_001209 [Pyrenodesmia sp. 3 TL-2023]
MPPTPSLGNLSKGLIGIAIERYQESLEKDKRRAFTEIILPIIKNMLSRKTVLNAVELLLAYENTRREDPVFVPEPRRTNDKSSDFEWQKKAFEGSEKCHEGWYKELRQTLAKAQAKLTDDNAALKPEDKSLSEPKQLTRLVPMRFQTTAMGGNFERYKSEVSIVQYHLLQHLNWT